MTTLQGFKAALKHHDVCEAGKHWGSETAVRRALFAAWWYIENVPADDKSNERIFFKVRELTRNAL